MIKISFGRRRDFRVKMWGTSLLEEKLADDLGNVIEGRAESVVVSQIFFQRQIGAEQFETFSTASTPSGGRRMSALRRLLGVEQTQRVYCPDRRL